MNIIAMPNISTAHLTQEVAERLTTDGDKNPWLPCAAWEYGFFIYLADYDEHSRADGVELPQCLQDVGKWLAQQMAEMGDTLSGWVRFDADADRVDELPQYEW